MPQPAPNTEKIDEHLQEVIRAVHAAVKQGITDPKIADKAIQDCKEILEVIMEGNVSEWIN